MRTIRTMWKRSKARSVTASLTRRGWVATLPLTLLLAVALPAGAGTPSGLPDLLPTIDETFIPVQVLRDQSVGAQDVAEGCAGGATGRTLVRFTLTTLNQGTADVVLGDPGCPDCNLDPPPPCTNPLFECSAVAGHMHPHFSSYARYEILARADATAAAVGRKQGFCIEDILCDHGTYDCSFQGLAVGCSDSYFNFLGCQYVDVTDLPNGRYLLRAAVNVERLIPESNYDNNTAERPVEFCDATRQPTLRLTRPRSEPGPWAATGRVVYAKPPLLAPDPGQDGALVRLGVDAAAPLEVAIPGGPRGSGCQRRDGWRTRPRGAGWDYRNASGFLDPGCTVAAVGLRRLRIDRTADGFTYVLQGRVSPLGEVTPAAAETTVVLGRDTGPCGTAHIERCRTRGEREIICTGSPSGAFLEPEAAERAAR